MKKTIEKQHVRAYEAPVCEVNPLQMQGGILAGGGESIIPGGDDNN